MAKVGRAARVASLQRTETLGNGTSTPTDKTITVVETGELYFIEHNHASALTITLPPARTGHYFRFIFKTNLTADGSVVIKTSEGTAGSMIGSIFEQVTGGSNANSAVQQDNDADFKITLSDDIHQGSWVECFCDGSVWHVNGKLNVSGVGETGFGDYTSPNPAMTRLYAGFNDEEASYTELADVADVGQWETEAYDALGTGGSKVIGEMAYGKDGSGNALLVMKTSADTNSLYRVTPAQVAAETAATNISFNTPEDRESATNVKQQTVLWGNDVWVSAGNMGSGTTLFSKYYIWRSTDGTSWNGISLTGSSGIAAANSDTEANSIRALTSDGEGNWWFGVGNRIFKSDDDASTWAEHAEIDTGASGYSSGDGGTIQDLVYTNNTVVALYRYTAGATDEVRAISAAGSATSGSSNWGSPVALVGSGGEWDGSQKMHKSLTKKMAAGAGRVIFHDTGTCLVADVDAKVITIVGARTPLSKGDAASAPGNNNVNTICTDGEGTWYAGMDGATSGGSSGGQIIRNTNNGLSGSWVNIADGINAHGDHKVESLVVDRYLPL